MDDRFSVSPRLVADGLIPRRVLWGPGHRWYVLLSRSGSHLSWLEDNNVWIAPCDDLASARQLTHFRKGKITSYSWFDEHILVSRDVHGDENERIHSVHIKTGKVIDMVAAPGVHATLAHGWKHHAYIKVDDGDVSYQRIDVRTGKTKLVFKTQPGYKTLHFHRGSATLVSQRGILRELGGTIIANVDKVLSFSDDAKTVYALKVNKFGVKAVVAIDRKSHAWRQVAAHAELDVDRWLIHPQHGHIEAVAYADSSIKWSCLDLEVGTDIEALRQVEQGDVLICSRSHDNQQWIVCFDRCDAPYRYYHYDRRTKRAKRLFASHWALEGMRLSKMRAILVKTKDRAMLPSYLSLPAQGCPPYPLVLLVHGGPHARDYWGYDSEHQWLADRGYAVLSVNFRGSIGFGQEFTVAGKQQWGRRMQHDLDAAVDCAIARGVADERRLAIMGASYGGYAALAGLAFRPRRYRCGVAFAGPVQSRQPSAALERRRAKRRVQLDRRPARADRAPPHAGAVTDRVRALDRTTVAHRSRRQRSPRGPRRKRPHRA